MKIPHLLAETSLKAIERACVTSSQVLIALDYDGTLVPYAETTAGAALPEDARALLRRLCGRPQVAIALLSGRPLKEMQKLAGIREATIAALHGLELLVGGEREDHDDLVRAERIIEVALEELAGQLDDWEDVRVENKRVCLTLHHPKLTKKGADELSVKLEDVLKAERVQMVRGKKSIEILPDIAWDRGLSVRRFMEHHRKLGTFPLLICAGDDAFDAHALRMARDMSGIAIGVGREAARSGNYYAEGPAEILLFLERLDGWLGARTAVV